MGKPEKEDPDACAPPRIAATYQALRSTRPEVEIVTLQESGGPSSMHSTQRTIEEALRQHPAPDAVICTADQPALGAMRALAQAGLRVGHDVAVTGFNDDPMSAFLTPSLTTVRIPVETLGKQGARLLMDLYTHKQIEPVRIKVETTLMERESGRLDRRG
jgi:LacI family transcriptional regulator